MTSLKRAALAASFVFLAASHAAAGGFGVTADGSFRTMSNSPDTEKAIFDTKGAFSGGFGLTWDLNDRWRFGIEGRQVSRDGERAFALDAASPAFRLGHPLKFKMTQVLATGTFSFGKLGPVTPYVTVGAGQVSWKETSTIAGLTESASGSSALFEARVGFERRLGRVRIGLEGGMALAPGAVGAGGISQVYGEKDIGGLFGGLRLSFGGR